MSDCCTRIRTRDPESFPEELKFLLDIITINEVPKVVGSYAYKNHKYPSDIDVFERVSVNLDKFQASVFYANQFKNIFQKLLVVDKFYVNDFKAGIDDKGEPIRWSTNDVLTDGARLSKALMQPAVVKLDVIAWINSKFQSVEVFYNLRYLKKSDTQNNGTFDPLPQYLEFYPLTDYVKSLSADVLKYSSSAQYSPLKVIKRLWSLSRIQHCDDLINIIDPLLSSDVAALNQLKSDIQTISQLNLKIFSQIKNKDVIIVPATVNRIERWCISINRMFLQILSINKRLINHANLIDLIAFNDQMFMYYLNYKHNGVLDFKYINTQLENILSVINEYITSEGKKYLDIIVKMNIQCQSAERLLKDIEYER